ncbi:olfactory receptor 1E16-like [Amia ocellicauda]|uniref:olfactory receptor 1E16-like n=1 Tax=Amia ocellicauda TaxID=2972642 RepID=UPI0034647527|nr:OLF1 protein [Amia calva]
MSSQNSTASSNTSFVRPQFFYVNGFSNIPHVKYYYIFLCCVYAVTVFGNCFIMFMIYVERNLHTPKYVAVFNLAVVDLCGSTALIPNLIHTFLFNSQFITYEACFSNMFFVHFFSSMQSLTLVVLAYDRFVAICCPLKYHAIITNITMAGIIAMVWVFITVTVMTAVLLFTRLSFCKGTVINSYFCDHGPVFRLACNDNSPNHIMAIFCTTLFFVAPVAVIGLSYVCIIIALLKITTQEGRLKAMKTCTSHLILVAIFYFPICATYIAGLSSNIHPNARIINTSLATVIPPMLNPIIYSLKTEEIMSAIKKLYKRNKLISHDTED